MTTAAALVEAVADARRAWRPRASLAAAGFAVAALAPLALGEARVAELAGGLYLAVAATGLALPVGVGGLPCLAQGAFVATGAVVGARLIGAGVPTPPAVLVAAAAAGALAWVVGSLFGRLPAAGLAAATWLLAWAVAFGLQSLPWFLGGSQGVVVAAGPAPAVHFELALGLTALAALGLAAFGRAPLGLRLAAARDREAAAAGLGIDVGAARAAAFALAGTAAGVAGALGVELAGVGDPSQFGPYLSFKLFVVVLIGGAVAPLGATAGVIVLGVLSVAAEAIGSIENVSDARSHTLLAAVMLLGVLSLGFEGVLRPARRHWRAVAAPRELVAPRGLRATGIAKRYGAVVAADDVSLELEPGTITALTGANGSGKTTLLRILAGAVEPDAGTVEHGGVARTLQATAIFPSLTPLEHLLAAGARRRRHGGVVRSLLATPKARAEEAVHVGEARAALERFGIDPDAEAGELPVGSQRILMTLAAAATGAQVLLVDEPSSGASPAETARIASVLAALRDDGRALLVVEHNPSLVRTVADRVLTVDRGRIVETAR